MIDTGNLTGSKVVLNLLGWIILDVKMMFLGTTNLEGLGQYRLSERKYDGTKHVLDFGHLYYIMDHSIIALLPLYNSFFRQHDKICCFNLVREDEDLASKVFFFLVLCVENPIDGNDIFLAVAQLSL